MKHNILSLFLGLGVWGGLFSAPLAMHAQEDMSNYDVDIDLTLGDVDMENNVSLWYGQDSEYCTFSNNDCSFTDSTGRITGDGFLAVKPSSATRSTSLPIAVKGHNIWPGTYDVYVVMVPYYYHLGQSWSELPADSILQNKIRVSISRPTTSTKRGEILTYSGRSVDTLLVYTDLSIPTVCYQSYQQNIPIITIQSQAGSNDVQENGYTHTLYVDRVILKAKSVTPGETVQEGSFGEGFTYKLDTQTGVLAIGGNGELSVFPPIVGYKKTEYRKIIVEEGITSIGENLFYKIGCEQLSLPNSLRNIGNYAFSQSSISEIAIPASVESIGDFAFDRSTLASITFQGNALKSIGNNAFYDTPLRNIEIPEGVKTIGENAFDYADSLKSIKLPNSLEAIGRNAFRGTALTEIVMPAGLKTFGVDLFSSTQLHKVWWNVRAMEIFGVADPFQSVRSQIDTLYVGENVEVLPDSLCVGMQVRDIEIPEKVQTIGAHCFEGVPMASVNIPASVKSIGDYAFTTTQEFNVAEGNTAYTAVDGVLFSKDMTELVCYPHARVANYRIPDGVKKISNWAFGNKSLINVNVPASVNSLCLDVFANARTLTVAWKTAEELPELSFSADSYPMLVQVPYGSKEVYLQADGWKNCTIVNEYLVGNALAEKPNFSVFQHMMEATGWNKALMATEDEEYAQLYNEGKIYHQSSYGTVGTGNLSAHRYYGFTLLAEQNAVFEALLGKTADAITLQDLTQELAKHYEGKTDEDYASEEHILNRFVSYHLLPVKLPKDKLVIHYNENGFDYNNPNGPCTVPVTEYYETLGEGRRLLKMSESAESGGVRINRFMKIDRQTGHEIAASGVEGIAIDKEDSENASYINGYMYALDELLVYSDKVRDCLGSERMRYDVAALLPELANNDFRRAMGRVFNTSGQDNLGIPNNYPYFENLTINEEAFAAYLIAYGTGWKNYQGDEFCVSGLFDIIIKLPAVPQDGTYELRVADQSQGSTRPVTQVYFGNDKENLQPCGLPINFSMSGETVGNPINWMADTPDEVVNRLNDLRMRETGYMKGPKAYHAGNVNNPLARDDKYMTRKIIGQFQMEAGETYYLRIKTCLKDRSWEFYLDYIELVPQKVYDNPNEPEDQW